MSLSQAETSPMISLFFTTSMLLFHKKTYWAVICLKCRNKRLIELFPSKGLRTDLCLQLTYQKDEFFENVLKNLRGRTLKEMKQLDERVNRTLWTTTPAVVNAYYSRNRNQISELNSFDLVRTSVHLQHNPLLVTFLLNRGQHFTGFDICCSQFFLRRTSHS